jgi:hypothetical protein
LSASARSMALDAVTKSWSRCKITMAAWHSAGWIVAAMGQCQSCMAHAFDPMHRDEAAAREPRLQAPRELCMRGGVFRIELQCLFEKADRELGILRHGRGAKR